MNEDAIDLLKKSDALLEGHFLLSSGRHSDRYFQCARLLQFPDRAAAALAPVVARIKDELASGRLVLDAVCGPAMGGIVVAYELGRQLGLPAFFTERDEGGAMALRRGFAVSPGMRILIAEDVVTTGKSSLESAAALEAGGAVVVALACVVDRRAEGVDTAWPLFAAAKVEVKSWDADGCALCAAGSVPVKPGSRKKF